MVGLKMRWAAAALAAAALAALVAAFVVVELLAAGRRLAAPMWIGWGLTLGVLAGFATDFVVTRGGA